MVPDLLQRLAPVSTARTPGPRTLAFDSWEPDKATAVANLIEAHGVRPGAVGYEPIPGPQVAFGTLDSRAFGARSARGLADGAAYAYAGTQTKLYGSAGRAYVDRTRTTGGDYATAAGENWRFQAFRGDILATNFTDQLQGHTVAATGNFADWITGTAKPRGRHIGAISGHVFLGDIDEATEGRHPNRVWWSARNNSKLFDPDAQTRSDWNDFDVGGAVQGVVGGREYGVIFLRDRIERAEFTESARIFEFYPMSEDHGTHVPNSVIAIGRRVFYYTEQGFHMITGGVPVPIGHDLVDDWFAASFDIQNSEFVSVSFDPYSKTVVWASPNQASPTGMPNQLILYSWDRQRWACATVELEVIFDGRTQSYSLEDLDQFYPSDPAGAPPPSPTNDQTKGIDTPGMPSLDDPQWQAGGRVFAGINRSHQAVTFTGPALEATLTTGDRQFFPARTANVLRARPLTDSPSCLVAPLGRASLFESISYPAPRTMQVSGVVNFRHKRRGRYHRFKTTIPAGTAWNWAVGLDIPALMEKGAWL